MTDELTFEGEVYHEVTGPWLDANPDAAQVEQATRRLGLDVNGRVAARMLAETVREKGPGRGKRVCTYLFPEGQGKGAADQDFTTIFQFACCRHGMRRYKRDLNNVGSAMVVGFDEHAGRNHTGWAAKT